MASYSVLSAHVSSLLPSQIDVHVLDTKQRDLPLPDPNEPIDILPGHASSAYYYNAPEQPSILLRVIENRYTIQLSSVSSQFPPRLFRFPSPIISNAFIIPDQFTEAHVIAVTAAGSIYRIVLPVTKKAPLHEAYCSEQVLKAVPPSSLSLVHVSDPGLAFVGLKDGSILKLQARRSDGSHFSDWSESFMKLPMSLFGSFPLPGRSAGRSDFVSFASAPVPAQTEVVFTLSRDRNLRVWRDYCIGEAQLPATYEVATGHSQPSKSTPLLHPAQRAYIRVLPSTKDQDGEEDDEDANRRLVIFMPTQTDDAGGFFLIYRLSSRRGNGTRTLDFLGVKNCSERSAGSELRDFAVSNDIIWALWDSHGLSAVEYSSLNTEDDDDGPTWHFATPPPEPDFSPAHFDTLLSRDNCLVEVFMGALLRPSAFSRLTLKTALQQYLDALATLPNLQTSALNVSYPTLSEHIAGVVGCSVDLAIDPQTGEQLWDQYWSALKRDWEGFVARCREIERSARWPLGLAVADGVRTMILERERLGTVAADDIIMKYQKMTLASVEPSPANPSLAVFDIAWRFQSSLPAQKREALESSLTDVTREVIAFSYPEVAADLAQRLLLPGLEASSQQELRAWISSVHDSEGVIQEALDLITMLDDEVKIEEEEPEEGFLIQPNNRIPGALPPPRNDQWINAEWPKAFTAAYITTSVAARYELCLSLLILLLYLVDSNPDRISGEPSILGQAFASFQSISMLRFVTDQTAGDPEGGRGDTRAEDVLARLDNVRLSAGPADAERKPLSYSLVYNLLTGDNNFNIPESAQRFFRTNGLLQGHDHVSPLLPEVTFIDLLREQGFLEVAREIASWLPRAPGVTYELARIDLDSGRADEAALLFHSSANSFDVHGVSQDSEEQALSAVLPFPQEQQTLTNFYRHVTALFDRLLYDQHVITFAKLAIEAAPEEEPTNDLSDKVFRAYVALGLYEDAYMMIIETRDPQSQKMFIGHLVEAMCAQAEIDRLTRLSFVGFQSEVERTLSFKARNADPLAWPDYSKVFYAWQVFRGDYRSAGSTMYQHARRLSEVQIRPHQFVEVARAQAQCYLSAINALSLIDPKNAWVAVAARDPPATPEDESTFHGSKKKAPKVLCANIPLDYLSEDSKSNVEAIDLAAMKHEYMLVLSRIELAERYPDHPVANFNVGPEDIVSSYVQNGSFDNAISAARSLGVNMIPLFENLSSRCVQLSRIGHDQSDDFAPWLISDRVQSWHGTPAQRGWRYLNQTLERNDTLDNGWAYYKAVLETIFEVDRSIRLPPWLTQFFEKHQPEYLIKMCLKYDLVEDALSYSLRLIRSSRASRSLDIPVAMSSWLPYSVFDQVLEVVARMGDLQPKDNVKILVTELRAELGSRLQQTKKQTQESRRR